jgi:hypothetical protein
VLSHRPYGTAPSAQLALRSPNTSFHRRAAPLWSVRVCPAAGHGLDPVGLPSRQISASALWGEPSERVLCPARPGAPGALNPATRWRFAQVLSSGQGSGVIGTRFPFKA